MTTVLSALLGCVPWSPSPVACGVSTPCSMVLDDARIPVQATVLAANVFDAPLFEAWFVLPDETGIRRVLSADPEVWGVPSEIILLGDHPAAMFDAVSEQWRLCRRQAAAVVCATSVDGTVWHDTEHVWPAVGSQHPRWPLALVEVDGEPALFVLAEQDDRVGIYRARHDGGEAFVLDAAAIVWTTGGTVPVATVARDREGLHLLLVDDLGGRAWGSTDGEVWIAEEVGVDIEGATWLAAETWFGQRWVWGS